MPLRVAVVGLGAIGAATLAELAGRDIACVGFEQYEPGHPHGASGGGQTRILRTLHPDHRHAHLLRACRSTWLELAATAPWPVFEPCAALTVGVPGQPRVAQLMGAAGAGSDSGPAAAVLSAAEGRTRWPQHRFDDRDVVVLDRGGGLLHAAGAVRALLRTAGDRGAVIRSRRRVDSVAVVRDRIEVRSAGETDDFDAAVIATGLWLGELAPAGPGELTGRRIVLGWLPVRDVEGHRPERFPPGYRAPRTDLPGFTFFPVVDGAGLKVNLQVRQPAVPDPRRVPAAGTDYGQEHLDGLRGLLPGAGAGFLRTEAYADAYLPDRSGALGLAGSAGPRLVTVAGFSGQGFKYAPAIGAAAADLALAGVSGTAGLFDQRRRSPGHDRRP